MSHEENDEDILEMAPDYDPKKVVGDKVTVNKMLCGNNKSGGTVILEGAFEVILTKMFWDYECGWRYHVRINTEDGLQHARKQGAVGDVFYASEFDMTDPSG